MISRCKANLGKSSRYRLMISIRALSEDAGLKSRESLDSNAAFQIHICVSLQRYDLEFYQQIMYPSLPYPPEKSLTILKLTSS